MKQSKIAAEEKISPVILNQILNGRRSVSRINTETAMKIAKILEWPLERVVKAKPFVLKKRFISLYECED